MSSGYVYARGVPVAAYGDNYGERRVTVSVTRPDEPTYGGEVFRVADRAELDDLIAQLRWAATQWDQSLADDKKDGVSGR